MRLKLLTISLIMLSIGFTAKAQSQLGGIILDQESNKSLGQVHVVNITQKRETISDAKGEFKILTAINDILVFSTLGYTTDTVLIVSFKRLKHYLKTDVNNLQSITIKSKINYRKQYAQVLNKANPILLKPGRGLLFYPSGYFSKEGRQARYFKRMIKREQTELPIDQKFNLKTVTVILPLKQPELDFFMLIYRPSLAFVNRASADDFKFYLIEAYNKFKRLPAEKRQLIPLNFKENN